MTESRTYNDDNDNPSCLYNSNVSIEKAENVVKDPKRPIIKKYLISNSETSLLFKKLINKPIKKEPSTLIKRVPIGKKGK